MIRVEPLKTTPDGRRIDPKPTADAVQDRPAPPPLVVEAKPILANLVKESLDGIALQINGAGHLMEFSAFNASGSTVYLQLHDSGTLPPNGSKPKRVWTIATLEPFDGVWPTGRPFRSGLCLVYSSTQSSLTAVTTNSGTMEASFVVPT